MCMSMWFRCAYMMCARALSFLFRKRNPFYKIYIICTFMWLVCFCLFVFLAKRTVFRGCTFDVSMLLVFTSWRDECYCRRFRSFVSDYCKKDSLSFPRFSFLFVCLFVCCCFQTVHSRALPRRTHQVSIWSYFSQNNIYFYSKQVLRYAMCLFNWKDIDVSRLLESISAFS